jgi:two-component system nitrate/nitrite response regulator NarL
MNGSRGAKGLRISLKKDNSLCQVWGPLHLATERIKKSVPNTKVLVLSMHKQKEYALRSFRAGADGYLLKDNVSEDLINALEHIGKGNQFVCPGVAGFLVEEYIQLFTTYKGDPINLLSIREKEVLRFLVEGKTNKEIASGLGISLATIKTHRSTIMRKLGVHTIASLTNLAVEQGVIHSIV